MNPQRVIENIERSVRHTGYVPAFQPGPIQYKWINALKTGEFLQNKFYLCTCEGSFDVKKARFCCLGVWEYLRSGSPTPTSTTDPFAGLVYSWGSCKLVLSPESAIALGLHDIGGEFSPSHKLSDEINKYAPGNKSLANLNDSEFTFAQIAEFVELLPDLVFTKSI